MRGMFGLVLVAGVALAGSAVYLAQGYIGQTQTQLEQERQLREKIGPVVQVYVVTKTKNFGDPLLPDDVKLVYWPRIRCPKAFLPIWLCSFRRVSRKAGSFCAKWMNWSRCLRQKSPSR
ncbi:MAG: hypothetical protein U5N53_16560 [Mycobacterium sp.]|nr:hypothetical protein [Mycobacterium sp.]